VELKIAPNDLQSMSQDGDAILRSLQNKTLPIMDLMVRESLQNSLDATLPDAQETKVEFKINRFETEDAACYFEGVEDVLNEKYPGQQWVISVSDKNTSGLTGDFRTDDPLVLEKSNFQKLVFGIGKNQDKEGAGGSWGLGKTSYFRLGKGIVIYYTRIKTDTGYEERLIASLIESPKQEDRLLPESLRGIAWWGEYDESRTKILPLTDSEEIRNILELFSIENYKEDETGSTIIIPFIDEINVLEESLNSEYPWLHTYEEEIKMAVQRWYVPRIMNPIYSQNIGNSWLNCLVNGQPIMNNFNIEPVFEAFSDLYNSALTGKSMKDYINVLPIKLPKYALKEAGQPIGHVAFAEISKTHLKMGPPDYKPSALAYLGFDPAIISDENNNKVMAYCRKPGMIIEYSTTNDWIPANITVKEDHFLLGFFVPSSQSELIEKYQNLGYKNVEAYLRATENADHATWADEDSITIIKRIKSYTLSAIMNTYKDPDENEYSSATSGLSRKFGSMLLPPRGYGKRPERGEDRNPPNNGQPKKANSTIVVSSVQLLDEKKIEINFNVDIKKNKTAKVFLDILGQDQKIDYASWLKTFGNQVQFPFKFKEVEIKSDNTEFELSFESGTTEFKITSLSQNDLTLSGLIRLEILSDQYQPQLSIKTENKTNDGVDID